MSSPKSKILPEENPVLEAKNLFNAENPKPVIKYIEKFIRNNPGYSRKRRTDYGILLRINASAYMAIYRKEKKKETLLKTVELLKRSVNFLDEREAKSELADSMGKLGFVYNDLAAHGNQKRNLHESVKFFKIALDLSDKKKSPDQWAKLRNNLGVSYEDLSRLEYPKKNLLLAQACYKSVATLSKTSKKEIMPELVQTNLKKVASTAKRNIADVEKCKKLLKKPK